MIEVRGPGGVTRLSWEEFEAQVRSGALSMDTMVRLEAVTGRRFRPAGSLELVRGLVESGEHRWALALRYAAPLVTAALVGVQVRVYLWSRVPGVRDWLMTHAVNWSPGTLELGQVYRLFSSGLLHLDFTHLALNMLFLAWAGANLERALGRRNLVVLFGVSVVCGALLSMAMSPSRPSLGASGGDFGLLAAAVVFGWKNPDLLPPTARVAFGWGALPYLVYPLLTGLVSSGVDNWGHLGGLVGGAAVATWLEPEGLPRHQANNRSTRRVATALTGAAVALVALLGPRVLPLRPLQAEGLVSATPRGWAEGWTFTDDRGWISPTRSAALVFATRTWERAQTPEEAVSAFFTQLDARLEDVDVLARARVEVSGWPAQRLTLRFTLAGEPQQMEALVVCQGQRVTLVHLYSHLAAADRYAQLAERVFARTRLELPPSLVSARQAHAASRRAWRAALRLGVEAQAAGYPDEAHLALSEAWELAPDRQPVALALLGLYASYPELAEPGAVQGVLDGVPLTPQLAVAAARAWWAQGRVSGAHQLLDEAGARWPLDLPLRRARVSMGLSPEPAPGEPL